MKTTINKIAIFGSLFTLLSCEGFLDEKPQKSLLVPESVQEVRALLDGYNYLSLTPLTSFIMSDEWKTTSQDWQSFDPWQQNAYLWKRNIFEPQERSSDYQTLHGQLFIANTALNILDGNANNQENAALNELRGEALTIRARVYFDLALLFLPGPQSNRADQITIPINLTADINAPLEMLGIPELLELIEEDLETAVEYLPTESEFKTRPDKLTAKALLSRVHLYQQNWDEARDAATYVIQNGQRLLDYSELNPAMLYPFELFNQETVFFQQMQTSVIPLRPSTNVVEELYELYDENDLRKALFFRISPTTSGPIFKGSYTGGFRLFSGITLSEMYLTAAESAIRTRQIQEGLEWLNQLGENRYSNFQPWQNLSQEEALEEVLKERRREMVYRNMRWMDMKRTKYLDLSFQAEREIDGTIHILNDEEQFVMEIPPYELELGRN